MTRLYLIRHGSVDADGMFYGQLDVPLAPAGERQLQRAADALAGVELAAIHSSDLQRTVQGATAVARPHGLEVQPDAAFREMNLGVLEGVPFLAVRDRHPELATRRYQDMWDYRFPGGGENLQDLADRINPALEAVLARHPQDTVVLVAHNSPNRVILGQALGLPLSKVFDFSQDFGCINCIDFRGKELGTRSSERGTNRGDDEPAGIWEGAKVRFMNWRPDAPSRLR